MEAQRYLTLASVRNLTPYSRAFLADLEAYAAINGPLPVSKAELCEIVRRFNPGIHKFTVARAVERILRTNALCDAGLLRPNGIQGSPNRVRDIPFPQPVPEPVFDPATAWVTAGYEPSDEPLPPAPPEPTDEPMIRSAMAADWAAEPHPSVVEVVSVVPPKTPQEAELAAKVAEAERLRSLVVRAPLRKLQDIVERCFAEAGAHLKPMGQKDLEAIHAAYVTRAGGDLGELERRARALASDPSLAGKALQARALLERWQNYP